MDKALYIFVKQNETKPTTIRSRPESAQHVGTRTIPRKAAMQPTAPVDVLRTNTNTSAPERPPSRRRHVTIGGPDRHPQTERRSSTRNEARGHDQAPLASDLVTSGRNKPQADMQTPSKTDEGSATTARSTRRPYPPSSWKSSSTVDSAALNQKTRQGARPAGSEAPRQVNEMPGGATLPTSKTIVAVENPKPEECEASGKLARKDSRRQYTIGSSNPTHQAAVLSLEIGKDKSSHTTGRGATEGPILPDPETAYAHTFYYTTCPHTSPPKPRPLNVQPTLVQYNHGLLAQHPSKLIDRPNNTATDPLNVYILEGPCADCDLSARRRAESDILDNYTHKLENLTIQLSLLQRDIVSEHPEMLANRNSSTFSTFTLPSTLELTPEATQSVVEIEDQLNELIKKRDGEVKQVWQGFTARWGPGTVQIHRDDNVQIPVRSRSRSTARTVTSTISFHVPSADTTPEKSATASSVTSAYADGTVLPSPESSFANRVRASSTQERYSDGTHDIVIDSSVDGVRGRGRMLVDWIRPDQLERKPDGGNDMPRRKSSRHGR
ncbi:hypothetical protein H2200_007388 [Cladophialophora chaetospira]|uniref:Uncharacterized protein n=1 Tax=Cladophialophora chaetospira TaxID=386627 RepID=A0AA38X7P8_9EURO|nr:hypothetical protein H2200_007388 [Cladophialophora chaetospira]